MTITLANLLTKENRAISDWARAMDSSGYAAPYVALVLISVLAVLLAGYLLWRHRRRQMQQPGSRALLRRLSDTLGILPDQRRLLWHLGRSVGLEPAAALVGPAMLMEMVHRVERRGERLSDEQSAQVAELLDVVTTASNPAEG